MAAELSTASTTVSMTTLALEEEARPRTASTLSRMFRRDPDEATPTRKCSVAANSVYAPAYAPPSNLMDPPLKYHPLCEFSFLVKIPQLMIASLCLGLHTRAMVLIIDNITTQTFPLVVCASTMINVPVILISYVLGQKMPELLIRIFNLLGGILFFVSSILLVVQWTLHHEDWEYNYPDIEPAVLDELIKMLLAECAFCMINAFICIADLVMSLKRTLSFL